MTKKNVLAEEFDLPVAVERMFSDVPGKRSFPNLYHEVAVMSDDCPIRSVGVSISQPSVFYLFRREGGFYTVNVHPALEALVNLIADEEVT